MTIIMLLFAFPMLLLLWMVVIYKTKPLYFASFSAITSTLQFYVLPVGGIFFSLSFLAGLFSFKSVLNNGNSKYIWLKFFVLLEIIRAISIAWSPVPSEGIRYILYELTFIFIFFSFSSEDESKRKFKETSILIALATVSLNALLVILFRLVPAIESLFWHSGISSVFISSNSIRALLTSEPGNVLDTMKAGGVFVNANIAAVHLGLSAFLAISFGKVFKSKILTSLGVLNWVAVFFAGSKAAIVIGLVLPIVIYFIGRFYSHKFTLKDLVLIIWIIIFLFVVGGTTLYFLKESSFAEQSGSTLESRLAIWEFARIHFLKNPFLGLGFGGWTREFSAYAYLNGIPPNFPPHNSYLVLWAQSGLLALVLAMAFSISLILNLLHSLKINTSGNRLIILGILGAFSWLSIQSLGENYGFIGESHIIPLLAMVLGYAASIGILEHQDKKEGGR